MRSLNPLSLMAIILLILEGINFTFARSRQYIEARACFSERDVMRCLQDKSRSLTLPGVVGFYNDALSIAHDVGVSFDHVLMEHATLKGYILMSDQLSDPNNPVKMLAKKFNRDIPANCVSRISYQLDIAEKLHRRGMFVAINYIVDRLREYVDAIGLSQSDPARCRIENLFRYVNDNLLQGGRFYTKKHTKKNS